MRTLEFGWFLPTSGDTVSYGRKDGHIPPSMEAFERIAAGGGFYAEQAVRRLAVE